MVIEKTFAGFPVRIEYYDEVTSTNEIVLERARKGENEGLVISAGCQTGGKGRLNRPWYSPHGNLYCSLLLRPTIQAQQIPSLSLLVSLCMAGAIGQMAELKWPNDILINQAKTSGILLEKTDDAVVVGTGVNIRHYPDNLPYQATCLAEAGIDITPQGLLGAYLDKLGASYQIWLRQGFSPFVSQWMERCPQIGKNISLKVHGKSINGIMEGIDASGNLKLDGHTFSAGEISA